jgi:hypothetical protein
MHLDLASGAQDRDQEIGRLLAQRHWAGPEMSVTCGTR